MSIYKKIVPVLLLSLFIVIFYQNCSRSFSITQSSTLSGAASDQNLIKFKNLPNVNSLLKNEIENYNSFAKMKGNLIAVQADSSGNRNVIIYDLTNGKAIDIFLGCSLMYKNTYYLDHLLIACENRFIGYNPEANTSKVFFRHNNDWITEVFTYRGELYFDGKGVKGRELYKYNSQSGVELVKDINPNGSSSPRNFTEYNGQMYFSATGDQGAELYKYDPQTGTELVENISPNESNSHPKRFTEFNGELFFTADGPRGTEIYKYHPQNGVEIATDIRPNGSSSYPDNFIEHDGELYYTTLIDSNTRALYKYHPKDGAGPVEGNGLNELRSLHSIIKYKDELYFLGTKTSNASGYLYKYNSKSGLELVVDLKSEGLRFASRLSAHSDGIYFIAYVDGQDGKRFEDEKIFKYNPQSGVQAINILNSEIDYNPKNLTEFDGSFYYVSRGVSGVELYKYHPRNKSELVVDLTPESGSYPNPLAVYKEKLYFNAFANNDGFSMFKYDSQNGAVAVKNAELNSFNFRSGFFNYKGDMFFSSKGDNGDGVYKFNPETGVKLIKNINPEVSSHPKNFTEYNGELFFTATNQTSDEVYKYHPNTGVQLVEEIRLTEGSEVKSLTVFNNELYLESKTASSAFFYKYTSSEQFVYTSYYPNHTAGNVAVASKLSFQTGFAELLIGSSVPQTPEIFKSDNILEVTYNVSVNNGNYILGVDALNRGRLYVYLNSSLEALSDSSVDIKSINKLGSSLLIFYRESGSAEIKAKTIAPGVQFVGN